MRETTPETTPKPPYQFKARLVWTIVSIPFVGYFIYQDAVAGAAVALVYLGWVFAPGAIGMGGEDEYDD